MTYYGGKQLAAAFRTVRNNTIKIAEEIPEGKYDFRPSPDTRSVQQTLAPYRTVLLENGRESQVTNVLTITYGVKVSDSIFKNPNG